MKLGNIASATTEVTSTCRTMAGTNTTSNDTTKKNDTGAEHLKLLDSHSNNIKNNNSFQDDTSNSILDTLFFQRVLVEEIQIKLDYQPTKVIN